MFYICSISESLAESSLLELECWRSCISKLSSSRGCEPSRSLSKGKGLAVPFNLFSSFSSKLASYWVCDNIKIKITKDLIYEYKW